MPYTKQNWVCGDEITAEKLNHMEDGIENAGGGGSGVLNVTYTVEFDPNDGVYEVTNYSHTYAQILDAYSNGDVIIAHFIDPDLNGEVALLPLTYYAPGDIFSFFLLLPSGITTTLYILSEYTINHGADNSVYANITQRPLQMAQGE